MKTELTKVNPQKGYTTLSLLDIESMLSRGSFSFKIRSQMKVLFFISLFLWSSSAWTQPWQDALKDARESYLVKSYDQAVKHYQTAQQLAPKNIDLSIELAQSLYKAERYEEAEKLYQLQLNKKQNTIQNSEIQRQLGNSRMHQEKYKEAIDAYKSSLRENPRDDAARYNLAKAMKKQQEKENPEEKKKENQDQNNPPDSKEEDSKPKDKDVDEKNNSKSPPQQNKQADNPAPEKESESDPSLSDKRTERLLDELTKKEKETKRHMNSKLDDKSKARTQIKNDW